MNLTRINIFPLAEELKYTGSMSLIDIKEDLHMIVIMHACVRNYVEIFNFFLISM